MTYPWRAYLQERMRPRMLLAVTAGTVLAARGATPVLGWGVLVDACLALLLLAFFRIWDDLEALSTDSIAHPYRVLVLAPSVAPFVWTAIALAVAAALLMVVTRSGWVLLQFAGLCALLLGWYRGGRRHLRGVAAYHLLLLKYPALVLLVAQRAVAPEMAHMALGSCVIYGLACLYEGWHDERYAAHRWLVLVLGAEACVTAVSFGHYLKGLAGIGFFS